MRLTISGTVSPDCTTLDTGEPAGTHSGYDYWTWEAGEQEWFLAFVPADGKAGTPDFWSISLGLPDSTNYTDVRWRLDSAVVSGNYLPIRDATGTVIVTEYTPPAATTYATLTITDGPLAGQYIVLKTG